ncbi:MAG TPA: alpha/beta fold hydrolase, partial [Vicinamibacterales bacterium]|nr:alpha/beta fold hydrolase [Vicinamibacterales bacterium]
MALREIVGPSGRLEALLDEPAPPGTIGADGIVNPGHSSGVRAAVVFAHPHTEMGGTMHTKVVYQAAKALARIGCAVLRFNFRGAGTSDGAFSNGPGEMDDFRAALDFMHARYPHVPMWAGGMSFGSFVALTVGVEDPRVSTLIGIALPLSRYDFEPVARSSKPKFFIQGERDEICPLKTM